MLGWVGLGMFKKLEGLGLVHLSVCAPLDGGLGVCLLYIDGGFFSFRVFFFCLGMGWGLMTLRLARMTVTAFGCIIWVLGNGLGVGR